MKFSIHVTKTQIDSKMKILIIQLTSYEGKDTAMIVTPDPLFAIIDAETGEVLDNGYRSFEETVEAWKDCEIINTSPREQTR